MTTRPRRLPSLPALAAALLVALPLALLAGCEGWPRYLHLDDDPGEFVILERVVVYEDESLTSEQIQDAAKVASGTEILYFGFLTGCGYDETASWPEWPLHDLDGDGTEDGPLHAGWFTGDVDWIGFTLDAGEGGDVALEGSLEWDNRPEGTSNAPYQPGEPGAPWSTESDVDAVVFSVDGDERTVVDESAMSNDYPEAIAPDEPFADETRIAVAVACHHAVPTDFALRIVVR